MRRRDREITDPAEIAGILSRTAVCRLALHAEPYPYLVPLNYGFTMDAENRFTLYFHCAKEGEKLSRMRENPWVTFEVDGEHQLTATGAAACSFSYAYESVVGNGKLCEITDEAGKREGLEAVMRQFMPERTFMFDSAALGSVSVLRLEVHSITAKRNPKKQHDG